MPAIPNSILDTTKKLLGVDPDYDVFDTDIILHINSTFAVLQQIGVGPVEGFEIEDSTKLWTDFIPDNKRLNNVKTFMYLKVRQVFDPPATGPLMQALDKQIDELVFRLMVAAESDSIVVEETPVEPEEPFVPLYFTGG